MESEFDDCSWEQVYGLMRCTTKFEKAINSKLKDEEFKYFDY